MSLIPTTSNNTPSIPSNQPTFLSLQILSISTILVLCLILGATLLYVYSEVFIPAQTIGALPSDALLAPTKSIKTAVLEDVEAKTASSTTIITPLPNIFSAAAPALPPASSKTVTPGSQQRSR